MGQPPVQTPPSRLDQAAELGLLIAANQQASSALRGRVVAMLDHLWRGLGSWHRSDMERFIPQATSIAAAGQQQASALTAAFLNHWGSLHGVSIPTAIPTGALTEIRGIDPAVEYERPFLQLWNALSDGKTLPEAVDVGAQRVESLATTDMQLAKTKTAQIILSNPTVTRKTTGSTETPTSAGAKDRVVGYRRVLEGAYSCGLCVIASTQRYHVADLMPIHPGCDCSVAPIIGDQDPGRLLNAGDIAAVHAAIEERFGTSSPAAKNVPGLFDGKGNPVEYRDVIIVHEHGEIGPVLGVRGQDFKGPADLQTTP